MPERDWIERAVAADPVLTQAAELLQAEANKYRLERFAAGTTLRWRIPEASRSILLLYPNENGVELNLNRLYRHGWDAEARRLTGLLPPLRNPSQPLYPRIRPEVLVEHFGSFRDKVLPDYVRVHRDITHL